MISVICYGRNDSHGYNLHKRAAISFNCIAEQLTHSSDEIIFVDCNTQDDLPTFPEAISDTLTERAKRLLRIIRLRPHQYRLFNKGSTRVVSEPLCRNIAIRRAAPENEWILSTNTDMIFFGQGVKQGYSLSDIIEGVTPGFYELPRMELPEFIWESFSRSNPIETIDFLSTYSWTLHLNDLVIGTEYNLFDGPGDFQLFPKAQICSINGFNEAMTLGWHVDSNIAKRLSLLNGETKSLFSSVIGFHCNHSRYATTMNAHKTKENCMKQFITDVTEPTLTEQEDNWGAHRVDLEEYSLNALPQKYFLQTLSELSQRKEPELNRDILIDETFNAGLIYCHHHILPYLADHFTVMPDDVQIGYFSFDHKMLLLSSELCRRAGKNVMFLTPGEAENISLRDLDSADNITLLPSHEIAERADTFIFDFGLSSYPYVNCSHEIPTPAIPPKQITQLVPTFDTMINVLYEEKQRLTRGSLRRKFITIGVTHTVFGIALDTVLGLVISPYATRIRSGYLLDSAFEEGLSYPRFLMLMGPHAMLFIQEFLKERFSVLYDLSDIRKSVHLLERINTHSGEVLLSTLDMHVAAFMKEVAKIEKRPEYFKVYNNIISHIHC